MGMTVEEAEAVWSPPFDVWPDNWRAVCLFSSISTQWRVGMGGPVGLDYNVLYRKMDRMGLSPEAYDELEDEVAIMETTALKKMREGSE